MKQNLKDYGPMFQNEFQVGSDSQQRRYCPLPWVDYLDTLYQQKEGPRRNTSLCNTHTTKGKRRGPERDTPPPLYVKGQLNTNAHHGTACNHRKEDEIKSQRWNHIHWKQFHLAKNYQVTSQRHRPVLIHICSSKTNPATIWGYIWRWTRRSGKLRWHTNSHENATVTDMKA